MMSSRAYNRRNGGTTEQWVLASPWYAGHMRDLGSIVSHDCDSAESLNALCQHVDKLRLLNEMFVEQRWS
jgi:hypothetical protein